MRDEFVTQGHKGLNMSESKGSVFDNILKTLLRKYIRLAWDWWILRDTYFRREVISTCVVLQYCATISCTTYIT